MDRQAFRRRIDLEQAAGVLKSLADEGMIEAQHGIGVGVDVYLLKVADVLKAQVQGQSHHNQKIGS